MVLMLALALALLQVRVADPSDGAARGKRVRGQWSHLDLGRAPCAVYGVKYIDLVSLDAT